MLPVTTGYPAREGEILLRQPPRTGVLRVKVPHPILSLGCFLCVLAGYLVALTAASVGLGSGYLQRHQYPRTASLALAVVAAIIGAVWLHYLLRKFIQARSAAQPGGIDIIVFPASPLSDDSTNEIAAELRHALADVYLSGPSVVPGESAPQDFLTDVRSVAENARTPWGALLAALSLLSPQNVYRVTCAAKFDADSGRCGLTVEVSGYPRQDVSVTSVSGETWAQIARQAACHIAAYVLPRTKLSKEAPWIPWRGIKLAPDLFFHFDEARRLARGGRLEEALHHFNEAIALDPLNPYIRIERATVQDELGLWIDALGSYVDVVTLESWYDRRVWARYGRVFHDRRVGAPGWHVRSPHGAAALQVARFRMIASLASGYRLAQQWRRNTSGSGDERVPQQARTGEASRVIRRLRPLLVPYARLMMDAHGMDSDQQSALIGRLRENDLEILRRVFQFAALDEAAALRRDYGSYWRRRAARLPIGRASMRIVPILTLVNYHYVERAQEGLTGPPGPDGRPLPLPLPQKPICRSWMKRGAIWSRSPDGTSGKDGKAPEDTKRGTYSIRWLERADEATGWQSRHSDRPAREWPPRPDGLVGLVTAALRPRFLPAVLARRQGWQEHYNAGCVFTLGMITPTLPPLPAGASSLFDRHERLVRLAVDEFSRAVVGADSQFASRKSVWLGRGDQDLDDLRSTPEYITFVERYLPNNGPARTLPYNPTPLVVSGHIARIVGEYAALRRAYWQERDPWLPVAAAEFGAEADFWKLLREVCEDYRDWRTRLQLIRHAIAVDRHGTFNPAISPHDPWLGWEPATALAPTLPRGPGHPTSEERVNEWLSRSEGLHEQADSIIAERSDRLVRLGQTLSQPTAIEFVVEQAGLAASLRMAVADPELAGHLAAAWQAVDHWLRPRAAVAPGAAPAACRHELGVLRARLARG